MHYSKVTDQVLMPKVISLGQSQGLNPISSQASGRSGTTPNSGSESCRVGLKSMFCHDTVPIDPGESLRLYFDTDHP